MIIVLFDPYNSLLRHIGLSNLKIGQAQMYEHTGIYVQIRI